ncbi:MAG: decaprenyl-phosphate phosphoribosyltransferase [Solirubrobacterales bacterium]|nr:decaprenyl-phosphate phosphoribosyltransferase [Solirubrobacterales bacterium]
MPPVGGGACLPEDVRGDSIVVGAARGARAGRSGTVVRRPTWRAVLVTMRPKQWVKNVLVVAAAGAAGALTRDDVPLRVALACLAFCLLASGIYAINDVRDAPEDRRHPRKRFRPVAAGELDPRAATLLGALLIASGLALSVAVRPLLALVAVGYVALTVSYTIALRRVPILDIAAIAGGFVLRAVAGGVAAPVTLSRWFVLVVTSAAVLVAAAKRQAELRRTETAGVNGRSVLERYGAARLRLIIVGSAAVALFAYAVWAFALPDIDGIPWRPLTIIPFAACLARYGVLVRSGGGEAPEEMLLSDRWLALAGVVWLVVFALSVHAAG